MASSSDYALYYWPVPFRGQFIRAILAYAGQRWDEFDGSAVGQAMGADAGAQGVPFMGPPMLVDQRANVTLAQMPAIAFYLGETLGLMPDSVAGKAMTLKVVNDANDVIDELTMDGGREMWTPSKWTEFLPRLERWMSIFEEVGRRHELTADAGFMLGGSQPGVADIVTATLWGTMVEKLPPIGRLLDAKAPAIAGLVRRMNAEPALVNLAQVSREQFGDAYCGGEIEKSLRRVVK